MVFTYTQLLKGRHLAALPDDIKREILEIIAYIYPPSAVRLTLVSHDVRHWIEQIIYRTVYFSGQYYKNETLSTLEKFKRTIEARPSSFFAEHVKTLHFDGSYSVADVLPVLEVCTGVTDFGCYARFGTNNNGWAPQAVGGLSTATPATEVYEYIHTLPLERLFVSLENLTPLLSTPSTSDKSSLTRLTHLAVTDDCLFPAARFPALTHIAVLFPGPRGHRGDNDAQAQHRKEQGLALIKAALAKPQTRSVVNMLIDTRSRLLTALWDLGDERFVNFTLPTTDTKFVEDDLWDLAMEFPDVEEHVRYLEDMPYPRILTFDELIAQGY